MELINCPACNNKCSSQALTCPSCGHPFAKKNEIKTALTDKIKIASEKLQNQSKGSRNWMIATIVLGILTVGIVLYSVRIFYNSSNSSNPVFSQQDAANQKNTITIKAAIVYNYGGAQSVARTTFYLLNEDLNVIAKDSGIDIDGTPLSLDITADDLQSKLTNKPSRLMQAMKPHIVKTASTDFEGNARFENVPTGDYFIYGRAQTRGGWAIWNLNVQSFKSTTIILDQNNAISTE